PTTHSSRHWKSGFSSVRTRSSAARRAVNLPDHRRAMWRPCEGSGHPSEPPRRDLRPTSLACHLQAVAVAAVSALFLLLKRVPFPMPLPFAGLLGLAVLAVGGRSRKPADICPDCGRRLS